MAARAGHCAAVSAASKVSRLASVQAGGVQRGVLVAGFKKGVNVARVQQKAPSVMTREIRAVQSTLEALQQAAAFSDKWMCAFLHKHSVALKCGPEHVVGTLQSVQCWACR